MNGQLDGVNYGTRQEQCSIQELPFPDSMGNKPIIDIDAKNLKSSFTTQDGQIWFCGGYFYDGRHNSSRKLKQLIDGFNLLNEEEGLRDQTVLHYGMGFAHDTVMVKG